MLHGIKRILIFVQCFIFLLPAFAETLWFPPPAHCEKFEFYKKDFSIYFPGIRYLKSEPFHTKHKLRDISVKRFRLLGFKILKSKRYRRNLVKGVFMNEEGVFTIDFLVKGGAGSTDCRVQEILKIKKIYQNRVEKNLTYLTQQKYLLLMPMIYWHNSSVFLKDNYNIYELDLNSEEYSLEEVRGFSKEEIRSITSLKTYDVSIRLKADLDSLNSEFRDISSSQLVLLEREYKNENYYFNVDNINSTPYLLGNSGTYFYLKKISKKRVHLMDRSSYISIKKLEGTKNDTEVEGVEKFVDIIQRFPLDKYSINYLGDMSQVSDGISIYKEGNRIE